MSTDPRQDMSLDPETAKPGPVSKNEKAKSRVVSTLEILNRHKGNFAEILKSKILMNPEIKTFPNYNQTTQIMEKNKLGDYSMIKNTYASLIRETVPHEITESSKTFLELTAHKYDVDYYDLEEIFQNGMQYWDTVEDEDRSPEEYGIAFVNKAILNERRGGWFTKKKDSVQKGIENTEKIGDVRRREELKRTKEQISKGRADPNYAREVSADDDEELKRYIVRIDEDPDNHRGSRVGVHKVLGYNAKHAYLEAMTMHKDLRGGTLPDPKKRANWTVTIGSDRSAPGTEGMGVSKWAKRKPKKPKTVLGRLGWYKGKTEQELDSAPRVKGRKRRGGRGRGVPVSMMSGDGHEIDDSPAPTRRRRQSQLTRDPQPLQITHDGD